MDYQGAIRPDHLAEFWPQIRGLLAPAVEQCHGEFEVEDIPGLVDSGRMILFVSIEGERRLTRVVACEVVEYPRMKVLHVTFAAGRGAGELLPYLQDFAKFCGATCLQTSGSGAVSRLLRRLLGAAVVYEISRLEIPPDESKPSSSLPGA
jgi:hypothetical protein